MKKWKYQEQFVVTAMGEWGWKTEVFPANKEKEARSCYADFLVRYRNAEVDIRRGKRTVGSLLGWFYVTEDSKYVVSVNDDSFYYKLPNSVMTNEEINKYLNNIYDSTTKDRKR